MVESHLVRWLQTIYNTVLNSGIKNLHVGPKQHESSATDMNPDYLPINLENFKI